MVSPSSSAEKDAMTAFALSRVLMEHPSTLVYIVFCSSTLALLTVAFLACREKSARSQRARRSITPQYIESLLSSHHANVKIKTVTIDDLAQAGDGKASTTDRISLLLTFISNPHNAIPAKVMLKTSLLPSTMRIGGALLPWVAGTMAVLLQPCRLDRLVFYCINKYNDCFPHAPDAMYINETKVYKQLFHEFEQIHFDTPRVYGTEFNNATRTWSILLEDLTTKVSFPNATAEHTLNDVRVLLKALARLHGKYWNSPRFLKGKDLAWVPAVMQKGNSMHAVFEALGYGLIRNNVNSNPFEQTLLLPLGLSVEDLWAGLQECKKILATPPLTLCHGDAHVQNTYASKSSSPSSPSSPPNRVGMFDFQLTLQACWARDVSYLLGTSLSTKSRRNNENKLLMEYLLELKQCGGDVDDLIHDFEKAKHLYSIAMAWGLVIGWLICPPNNYGVEILSANVRRLVAACVDLNSFAILLARKKKQTNPKALTDYWNISMVAIGVLLLCVLTNLQSLSTPSTPSAPSSTALVAFTLGDLKQKLFPEFHAPHRNFSFPFATSSSFCNISILQQYKANNSGVGSAVWDGSAVLSAFIARRATDLFPPQLKGEIVVVEIGAGLGTVSITTSLVLNKLNRRGRVYVSDGDPSCLVQAQRNIQRHKTSKEVNVSTHIVRWGQVLDIAPFEPAAFVFAADVVFENEEADEGGGGGLHGANHAFAALVETFNHLIKSTHSNLLLLAYKRRRRREERFFKMMNDKTFYKTKVKRRYLHRRYRDLFEIICFSKSNLTCGERLGKLVY